MCKITGKSRSWHSRIEGGSAVAIEGLVEQRRSKESAKAAT